ncbi:Protein of unknown function (DUF1514), partial [Gilliamella apicola SCGC AB-598-B02]
MRNYKLSIPIIISIILHLILIIILGGWNGKSNTIAKLQKLVIPLRIYGQFSKLHYQLDIGQVIKDLF